MASPRFLIIPKTQPIFAHASKGSSFTDKLPPFHQTIIPKEKHIQETAKSSLPFFQTEKTVGEGERRSHVDNQG